MTVTLSAREHLIGRAAAPTLALSVLGSSHVVSCAHVGLAASLHQLWAPFARPAPDGGPPPTAYAMSNGTLAVDGEIVVTAATAPWLLANFAATLNSRALTGYHGLAVHAGVVARGGRAVAVPAVSGAGKSTLTAAACATAGFDYVSDEALCVRYEDGGMEAYPKPLALSPWSARAVGLPTWDEGVPMEERLYAPADLGATVAAGPLRLAHVVLPERGHRRARLVELTRAAALAALIEHGLNIYRRPGEALTMLAGLAAGVRAWRLTYGDPVQAAALLADRLD